MHFFKRNNMLKIILFSIWKIQIRLKKGGWGGNQTERRVRSNFMFWKRGFKFLLRANMIEQVLVFYPVNSTFRDPHWCTVWYLSQFSPTWVCYSDFTLSAHVLCLLQQTITTSWKPAGLPKRDVTCYLHLASPVRFDFSALVLFRRIVWTQDSRNTLQMYGLWQIKPPSSSAITLFDY